MVRGRFDRTPMHITRIIQISYTSHWHSVQQGGANALSNIKAHPSTANVPIIILLSIMIACCGYWCTKGLPAGCCVSVVAAWFIIISAGVWCHRYCWLITDLDLSFTQPHSCRDHHPAAEWNNADRRKATRNASRINYLRVGRSGRLYELSTLNHTSPAPI